MATIVSEVMTGDPICLDSKSNLYDAAREMRERDVGDVLVTESGELRGLVTDRDIVIRALALGRDPAQTMLGEIISGDLVIVEPDDSITRAVDLMRERAIRRLPVCRGGRPIAFLSIGDLAIAQDPESALADISVAEANR